jgi:hypothetical protein
MSLGEHRTGDRVVDKLDRVALPTPFDEHLQAILTFLKAADHAFEAVAPRSQRRLDRPIVQVELNLAMQARRREHLDPRISSGDIVRRTRKHPQFHIVAVATSATILILLVPLACGGNLLVAR